MTPLADALRTAIDAAAAARQLLLHECARPDGPRGEIGRCPADDEAELLIRQRLLAAFPGWGFLGEETGGQPPTAGHEHVWVVDPNDGTSAMQRGYRGHAVSIGLVRQGQPVLGVVWAVDAPDDAGDLFTWAEGCGPLRRNGTPMAPIAWRTALGPDDVLCLSQGAIRNPAGYLACIAPAAFIGLPSIAFRLALVAAGECTASLSLQQLSAWDIAAGHALLRGAGGTLVDESGVEITYAADGGVRSSWAFGGGRGVLPGLIAQDWHRVGRSGFGPAEPPASLAPVRGDPRQLVHDTAALRRAHGCLLGLLARDVLDQPQAAAELGLLLARSLVREPAFNLPQIAATYARWCQRWTHTDTLEACGHRWCEPVGADAADLRALQAVDRQAAEAGRAAEVASARAAAANATDQRGGGLARAAVLGVWGAWRTADEVVAAAQAEARLTHPHPTCVDAATILALAVAAAVREQLDAQQTYGYALDWARAHPVAPEVLAALEAAAHGPSTGADSAAGRLQAAFAGVLRAADGEQADAGSLALRGAIAGREALPAAWQQRILSFRPMPGTPGVRYPRPALFWPTDALLLAERLLASGRAA